MGKKMKLIPFFSNKPTSTTTTRTISTSRDPVLVENSLTSPSASPLPWQWASCANINTLSFRDKEDVDVLRMVNSAYACCSNSPSSSIVFNNKGNANAANCSSSTFAEEKDEREEPIFSSFSTAAEEGGPPSPSSFSAAEIEEDDDRAMEMVIKGLKSERLFFEPVGVTNSILDENNIINDTQRKSLSSSSTTTTNPVDITTTNSCSCGIHNGDETATTDETAVMVPYKESVIISMESKDPCGDFRQSMEEMVEAHGVKDWEGMEELLAWYLKVNGKNNHGYIVSAFVDLLIDLTSSTLPPPPPRMSSKNDDKNNDMMMNSSTSTSSVSANCSSGSSTSSFSICHYSSPSPSSSSPLSFPCSPRRSGSSSSAVVAAVSSGGHLSCSLLDPGDGAQ